MKPWRVFLAYPENAQPVAVLAFRPDMLELLHVLAEELNIAANDLLAGTFAEVLRGHLDGLPADGLPAGGLPANGLPANGLPANGLPANGLPANGLPAGGLPADGLPANGLPAGDFHVSIDLDPGDRILLDGCATDRALGGILQEALGVLLEP